MALLLFSLEEVISIISEKNLDLLEEQKFPKRTFSLGCCPGTRLGGSLP